MQRALGLTMALVLAGGGTAAAASAPAVSLRGSPAAMQHQNRIAKEHGLDFYRTSADIHAAVEAGELVRLEGDANYAVADFVRHPFLRPAAKLFVERLSAQYREACGQKLVVTSAVRPSSGQPSNAHQLSVHPAGMAVDLRVSDRASCRSWLESTLLSLEQRGVLNGIREFHPPHYHVAIFPEQYMAYASELMAAEAELAAEAEREALAEAELSTLAAAGSGFVAAPAAAVAPGESPAQRGVSLKTALLIALSVPLGLGALVWRALG
jgi:hypothetical protein